VGTVGTAVGTAVPHHTHRPEMLGVLLNLRGGRGGVRVHCMTGDVWSRLYRQKLVVSLRACVESILDESADETKKNKKG
jgi:hypothetical protein